MAEEFNRLANTCNNSYLPEYAALCFIGLAKCEKIIGNKIAEVDGYLKAARCFKKANERFENLGIQNEYEEYLEGAFKCYTDALTIMPDDFHVMKAAVIRELKTIDPHSEQTSNFSSSCHRIWDLEQSSRESIKIKDYVSALDKLTDIYDDITERKVEHMYAGVMQRTEISRLLLLCLLQLPPSVRYDQKLIEKYTNLQDDDEESKTKNKVKLPEELYCLLQSLVFSCQAKDIKNLVQARDLLVEQALITTDHRILLLELVSKYTS